MTAVDEAVARMFAANALNRAARAEAQLTLLTPRERELVREAAVMGWVQGVRTTGGSEQHIPHDRDIVRQVVEHCQSFDDMYPLLGGDLRDLVQWLVFRCGRGEWRPTRANVVAAAVEIGRTDEAAAVAVVDGLIEDEMLAETPDGLLQEAS